MKYYIGIDLGGTNLAAGLVDENARLMDKQSVPTNLEGGPEELAAGMRVLTDKLLIKNELVFKQIESIGVGVPGTANPRTGMIEFANNLGFYNVPFLKMLKGAFENKTIYFNNDANAAALGEYLAGAGKGVKSLIAVTLGTGIGGGIVLNDEIYEGVNFAAGEFGHMVIAAGGKECNCGRRGCFEAYASATALIEQTKAAMLKEPSSKLWEICKGDLKKVEGKTLFDGVRQKDFTSELVLEEYISCLAAGLVNLINIFQPEVVCLGGGISKAGDLLIQPLKDIIRKESYTRTSDTQTRLVTAQLENDAGIIGAALLYRSKNHCM